MEVLFVGVNYNFHRYLVLSRFRDSWNRFKNSYIFEANEHLLNRKVAIEYTLKIFISNRESEIEFSRVDDWSEYAASAMYCKSNICRYVHITHTQPLFCHFNNRNLFFSFTYEKSQLYGHIGPIRPEFTSISIIDWQLLFWIGFDWRGGVQNLEWSNVERPIFWNFKITNIKIAKDELFNYFIYEFILYYYFLKLLEHSKYLIILPNCKIF